VPPRRITSRVGIRGQAGRGGRSHGGGRTGPETVRDRSPCPPCLRVRIEITALNSRGRSTARSAAHAAFASARGPGQARHPQGPSGKSAAAPGGAGEAQETRGSHAVAQRVMTDDRAAVRVAEEALGALGRAPAPTFGGRRLERREAPLGMSRPSTNAQDEQESQGSQQRSIHRSFSFPGARVPRKPLRANLRGRRAGFALDDLLRFDARNSAR
jgi:hypothetical protein